MIFFHSFSGVAIIFLTISALLIVSLALFLSGLVLRRGACDPLRDPEHDQIFTAYIDKFIDINRFVFPKGGQHQKTPSALHGHQSQQQQELEQSENEKKEPLRISQIISDCHRNKSIFDVFRIQNHVNISQIQDFPRRYGIDNKLTELADNVVIETNIEILSSDARREIRLLAKSGLNRFEAYKYIDNLTPNITLYNLETLADRLKLATKSLAKQSDIRSKLEIQELHLRSYQKDLVVPMENGTNRLIELAKATETTLNFKQTTFEQAITKLMKEIEDAERFINEEGTSYIQRVAHQLLDNFSRNIKAYLNLVINVTTSEVGQCEPISNVYNATLVAVCNRVVDPYVSLN